MGKAILPLLVFIFALKAQAFCGYYVAKADTSLFNEASKVVMVRDGNRTVLTMANDFQGEVNEFAMVVPVPTVLKKGQIHITENKLIDHLDAYTAPRLVEYFDPDPCQIRVFDKMMFSRSIKKKSSSRPSRKKRMYGVKVEAKYTVGEYDILILSAKESGGLLNWLKDNGYKVGSEAGNVLGSYIKQGQKFFVAKVNLKEKEKLGYSYLRPLQMAFESKKFMLPIRLGMSNSKGSQELFIFALTKKGRVETVNYRTVKIPTDVELPPYIKQKTVFPQFYKDMFETSYRREEKKVVFMEYAWDMGWCDPCAADPLSSKELKELGVFWVNDRNNRPGIMPMKRRILPRMAQNAYVTRLHVRYDKINFPDDLRFQVTGNRKNFQGRYILRHPFSGEAKCKEAEEYFDMLEERQEKEASNLAHLTGWKKSDIMKRMGAKRKAELNKKWWEKIWN